MWWWILIYLSSRNVQTCKGIFCVFMPIVYLQLSYCFRCLGPLWIWLAVESCITEENWCTVFCRRWFVEQHVHVVQLVCNSESIWFYSVLIPCLLIINNVYKPISKFCMFDNLLLLGMQPLFDTHIPMQILLELFYSTNLISPSHCQRSSVKNVQSSAISRVNWILSKGLQRTNPPFQRVVKQ